MSWHAMYRSLDLSTELFGTAGDAARRWAPIGIAGLNARRRGGAGGARRRTWVVGIPFCLSTVSACSLAEVAAAVQRPFWFQLYMISRRPAPSCAICWHLSGAAHCSVLVFTVDLPVSGPRYRDVRFRARRSAFGVMFGTLRRAGQALDAELRWAWDVGDSRPVARAWAISPRSWDATGRWPTTSAGVARISMRV